MGKLNFVFVPVLGVYAWLVAVQAMADLKQVSLPELQKNAESMALIFEDSQDCAFMSGIKVDGQFMLKVSTSEQEVSLEIPEGSQIAYAGFSQKDGLSAQTYSIRGLGSLTFLHLENSWDSVQLYDSGARAAATCLLVRSSF